MRIYLARIGAEVFKGYAVQHGSTKNAGSSNKHESGFASFRCRSNTHKDPENKHSDLSHGIMKQLAMDGCSEKT
jgi:hypothetical protein